MELGGDEIFELKLIFLRELGTGHVAARGACERLQEDPADGAALDLLRSFFHRIAGTAGTIGFGQLGRLASACEMAAEAMVNREMTVSARTLRLFENGLAGVASVLEGAPETSSAPPASLELRAVVAEGTPSRILVVDDDLVSARLVDGVLRAAGFASSFCCEPARAWATIESERPDLIILDVVMPGLDGFELCRRVRANPGLQLTPIIFVTRRGDVDQRVRGLEAGGNDYVAKPFDPAELVARVRSHLQRLGVLREMAIRDGLTRCYNNKYFKERLQQEIQRAQRYHTDLTVGMLDLDHFKRINDSYGHPAGDAVLANVASILIAAVRSTDVVARYGGEEFGFLLVQAAVPESTIVTNRLRERIARHRFELPATHGDPLGVHATVSIGIAPCRADDTSTTLLGRADEALYEAKANGRNQVRVAP